MLKKIVFAVLIVGALAILGVGLVTRFFVAAPTTALNQPNAAAVPGAGSQFRRGGQGQSQGQGQGQGVAAQGVQWTTLQGTVTDLSQTAMTVQTSTGEKVVITNRPWSYALEQKFAAKVGDQLLMTGFYQNGLYEIGQMQNLTNGSTVQVRDQFGRPGWSGGRGKGGQRGYNTN